MWFSIYTFCTLAYQILFDGKGYFLSWLMIDILKQGSPSEIVYFSLNFCWNKVEMVGCSFWVSSPKRMWKTAVQLAQRWECCCCMDHVMCAWNWSLEEFAIFHGYFMGYSAHVCIKWKKILVLLCCLTCKVVSPLRLQ